MGDSASGHLPRHFGDPAEEFAAATQACGVVDQSHRARFEVWGRAPGQMLQGVITGSVPSQPRPTDSGLMLGRASYSAVLTPKGRMVTDLRLFSAPGEEERLLLDVPRPGAEGLRAHLARFVPPRLARVDDVSADTAMITVLGPGSSEVLASSSLFDQPQEGLAELSSLSSELDLLVSRGGLTICRTGEVSVQALDVLGAAGPIAQLWQELRGLGARPVGQSVWQTLRLEAGRPEFGTDMTEQTLPPEAGIHGRAIDHAKGCYTGQEVIVRIRDRGHVNRHLRGLRFGNAPTPAAGTELFRQGDGAAVGIVTSAAMSPRFGEGIGLGYVRREIEPPGELRLGGPEGSVVRVVALGPETWTPGTD